MYCTEKLNNIEKKIIEIERKIEEDILKDGNIITLKQFEEIKSLPYVYVERNRVYGECKDSYTINFFHEDCELVMESTIIYIKNKEYEPITVNY